jgi:hypothetical protein
MGTITFRDRNGNVRQLELHSEPFQRPPGFVEEAQSLADYPQLPVPKPSHPDDILPQTSDTLLVVDAACQPCVNVQDFDAPIPVDKFPMHDYPQPPIDGILDPVFPPGAKLAYSIYWDLQKTYTLVGPQDFSDEVAYTRGASETDTNTVSAQLGVAAGDLSAKLTETTSHSVSVSTTTTETTKVDTTVDAGVTRILAVWQLVELFAIVDSAGNLLPPYGGAFKFYDRDYGEVVPVVGLPASFPAGQLVNRTVHITNDTTDFPAGEVGRDPRVVAPTPLP